jgi:hypothetical protein
MEPAACPVVVPLRLLALADTGSRPTPNTYTPAVAWPSSAEIARHSTVYSPPGSGRVSETVMPGATPVDCEGFRPGTSSPRAS